MLLLLSSYTANLAAFLTVERMDNIITSVEGLLQQDKIKYGVLRGGTSWRFLNVSLCPHIYLQEQYLEVELYLKIR